MQNPDDPSPPPPVKPPPEPLSLLPAWSGVLVPLLTLVFGVIVLLLPPAAFNWLWPPCREPTCFDYRREMALSLSDTVSPCDDFYGYVCSGFERLYPRQFNFMALLEARLRHVESQVLNDDSNVDMESVGGRVVAAFQQCMAEYHGDSDAGLEGVRGLVQDLGIHFKDKDKNLSSIQLLEALLRLSLGYGLPVLLDARCRPWALPEPGEGSERALVLQLDFEPMDPAPAERSAASVENVLRAVAHNGTILRFQGLAADVLLAMDELRDHVRKADPWPGGVTFLQNKQVDTLLTFVTPSRFVEFINSLLPEPSELEESGSLVSSSPNQVKALSEFLAVPEGTLHALQLVRYLLFEKLVPLATSRLSRIFGVGDHEAFRLRERACKEALRRVAPAIWQFHAIQQVLTVRRTAVAARVVSAVLNATAHEYAAWQDRDTLGRTRLRLRLLHADLDWGNPAVAPVAYTDARYRHVVGVEPDQVFVDWFIATLGKEAALVAKSGGEALNDTYDMRQLDVLRAARIRVDPLDLVVGVSPNILFGPFLVDDEVPPDGVNMGALGALVGSQVAAFVDYARGPYDAATRSRPWLSADAEAKYRKALACLKKRKIEHEEEPVDDAEAGQVLMDQLGVRIAYAAFRGIANTIAANATESEVMAELSALLGSPQRAFFAAYCFQLCGQTTTPSGLVRSVPARSRCNLVLRNLAVFWRAFECPVGSAMHPADPCRL
ncbi:endothelin-converting enzyme 2-like [Haemaphysalis longicornis]